MAQYKAKKIETFYDKHINTVVYEYRGCTYEVRYAKDWTISLTSAAVQHRDAQAKIDEEIDHPKAKHSTEDAQTGFDKLWDYMQTGFWEE